MKEHLVAAIDGENLAFAIATPAAGDRIEKVRRFRTADFPTFTDALQGYTRENGLSTSGLPFGLAVAGVTGGDVIAQANCRWYISVSGLRSFLASEPLVINDFAAIAWSLSGVSPSRLKPVGPVAPKAVAPGRSFLVVGTGPGLGMATLTVSDNGTPLVLPSEGGHSSFAPQNAKEDALLAALRRKFGHVSFERLLAGVGLQNIYACLAERDGRAVTAPAPEAIIAAAQRNDPLAAEAVETFCEILGSFVGNGVLNTGAFGGVFLVSPMLGTMLPLIERSRFRTAFAGKGRMRKQLELVPVSFTDSEDARLHGVAAALFVRNGAAAA